MRTWTKTAGLIFVAAMSVYADPATPANGLNGATLVNPGSSDAPAVPTLSDSPVPAAAPADAAAAADAPAKPAAPATSVRVLDNPATQPATPVTVVPKGKSVSADEVSVSDAGTVEIHVNEANLVEVLRMLSLQSQKNIIASKDVQGVVTANLYDVTVREALDAILKANGFGYREKGNFIYVYTAKELAEMEKSERHMVSEVFRLYYTPAANAQNMLKPVLSPDGQVAFTQAASSGITTGTNDVGGNTHATEDAIVITDYPENLDRARALLKELDRRPQQILVEATILRASLSDDNALGVDFNFLGGVDFHSFTDLNGQINNANIGSGNSTPGVPENVGAKGNVHSVGTGNNFTSGVNGFRVGMLTSDVSVFVTALETITNTTVLANPKVLALNKQRGEVIVGRKDGYYTTTVTQTATVQSVDFLETGTRLVFRPYVGDDGYVRMEIHPEDSQGGLNAANLPFKVTTEVTSNVLVKDGHTIVIGGLFRETNQTATNQVPFLGSLPLAGYLFRKQEDTSEREEVIILLTPHIIKDDSVYSENSEKMLQDANKLRVGVRQGMMPFSRTRLAEICYDSARSEMAKANPNKDKAIWYLNCATNLDPIFPEAIRMKETLSGEEVTATNHSNINGFVTREILAERAVNATTQPADRSVQLRSQREVESDGVRTRPTMSALPTTQPAVADETPVENRSSLEVSVAPADAAPTTQPAVAVAPTTQPAEALAPTTQPSLAEVSEQPTTQPALAEAAPSTQPSVAVIDVPVSGPSAPAAENAQDDDMQDMIAAELDDSADAAPTTQPAVAVAPEAPAAQPTTRPASSVTVTEVSTDPAAEK